MKIIYYLKNSYSKFNPQIFVYLIYQIVYVSFLKYDVYFQRFLCKHLMPIIFFNSYFKSNTQIKYI